jgi:hypothetical protein
LAHLAYRFPVLADVVRSLEREMKYISAILFVVFSGIAMGGAGTSWGGWFAMLAAMDLLAVMLSIRDSIIKAIQGQDVEETKDMRRPEQDGLITTNA